MLQDEATLPRARLDADYTARATVSDAEFGRIIGQYRDLTARAQASCPFQTHEFCGNTGLALDLYGANPDEKLIDDCRRALAWLWTLADRLGIDRRRIVVTGSSAGGHLAAALAQPGWQAGQSLPEQPLRGCLPVSGLFELAPLAASHVQDWMRFTPDELAQSPMRHPPRALRGALALAEGPGEAPGFHRQSDAYAALTGWPVLRLPARNHFDVILDLADGQTELAKALVVLAK